MDTIHINCDLGEGGEYDAQLMPHISACNIACGGHAGNLETMRETVELAMEHKVEMGAHPSYPDKDNFGRKSIKISAEELQRSLVAQILSLKQITEAVGGKLIHIKPHGALYSDAVKDEKTAEVIINSILEFEENFFLFVPPKSVISEMAKGKIKVVYEAFADRNYNEDYSLVSRQDPHALIIKKEAVFNHLYTMFHEKKISCASGGKIACNASTFCLHSDTPDSVEILKYLEKELAAENVKIQNT
ncbi:LamB/YcsF family protein [Salinimicrobium marinum]|uniref:LamB/YcsF family protein n=1 Tax=Salinimicrobium marinum TaxID=680283 RepID=A0A918S957_9FLAO|nr:5-oxoprolinase subunit PxpA [Salinimicrobium marinum]GHA29583.1 LamB/YcsF family protein [Salinimicrobium marinum]